MGEHFSVREMQHDDTPLLVSYWLNSSAEHLVGMGVDLNKLPKKKELTRFFTTQLELPIDKKDSYALIWLVNGTAVGHCNVNQIQFGCQAYMHLHLWNTKDRLKGLGSIMIPLSLQLFFEKLKLDTVFCEPYALNPAPNRILKKLGFQFIKEHISVPGSLNFEQPVLLWKITKEKWALQNGNE